MLHTKPFNRKHLSLLRAHGALFQKKKKSTFGKKKNFLGNELRTEVMELGDQRVIPISWICD